MGVVFREITTMARTQLSTIKNRCEEHEEDSLGDKEYMNDFASEEYVTKNIRVMPMGAGVSVDNTSEHTSKYYTSGMDGVGTGNSDFEDTKHNQEALHQMMD